MTKTLFSLKLLTLLFIGCNSKNIFVINSYAPEDDELVSVVVLFRHGDRAPISSYPTDPYYDISYWPEGYGQLVNKGKERQYELGQWLRKRYTGFLSEEYSLNEIQVISTDVDRTLMSAASNLAGLYPPPASQIWNEDLLWEPIPIHTIPFNEDVVLGMETKCARYDTLYEEVTSSEFFNNLTTEYKDLFDYVGSHTGWNVTTLSKVGTLYSVFYVYQNHNASYIPAWADNLDKEKFAYLAGLDFAAMTFTEELKRLKVGPFFKFLTDYFDNVVQNVTGTSKFLMLSAHDTTVSSVLNGMGAFDNWPPEFASTVLWEVRKSKSGTYYINSLYKRNSTDTLEQLKVNGCTLDCAYDDFKSNLESITIDAAAWEEECRKSNSVQSKPYWLLLFVITIFSVNI